jgi:hypothetical protein
MEYWMTPDYDDEPNPDYWAIADAIDLGSSLGKFQ